MNLSEEEGSLVYLLFHSMSILWDGTVHYSNEAEVGYGSTISDINRHNYTSFREVWHFNDSESFNFTLEYGI